MDKVKHFSSWIGALVSVSLVLWLLWRFDLNDALRALASAHYLYFLPAGLLILFNFVTRAQRWRALFVADKRPQLTSSFVALMVGYLANNVLPARAGEIVRSYVLGRRENLAMSGILATVIVERAVDLLIFLLMASALLLFSPLPSWAPRAGLIVAPVGLLSIAFLFALWTSGARCIEALLASLRFLPDLVILEDKIIWDWICWYDNSAGQDEFYPLPILDRPDLVFRGPYSVRFVQGFCLAPHAFACAFRCGCGGDRDIDPLFSRIHRHLRVFLHQRTGRHRHWGRDCAKLRNCGTCSHFHGRKRSRGSLYSLQWHKFKTRPR